MFYEILSKELRERVGLFQKLRKLFLYAGVEKAEYDTLSASIHKENQMLLGVFSPLAGSMFFLLFILSMVTGGFATVNSTTYLTCGIVMLAIFICVRFFVPDHPRIVTVLVILFEIVLYVFSIQISMLHADKPAVSAVAFLLVSPLLFYDRPVRLTALIAVDVAVFCGIVLCIKQPQTIEADIWNMVTFGVVAVVTTIFILSIKETLIYSNQHQSLTLYMLMYKRFLALPLTGESFNQRFLKIRALAQSKQIEYISQTDLLTGLKNRNHYEEQMQKYPEICTSNLICVYGDMNGLHEVNNRQGHPAGDRMLREVAATMQEYFGPEHTYASAAMSLRRFRSMSNRRRCLLRLNG